MKTALTIAGSDSSGGAGIQADLKTFSMLGVYGMSALTAITAQNTLGVKAVLELEPELVRQQIDCVVGDIAVDACKTGMLGSEALVGVVEDAIDRGKLTPYVCDPVLVAKSGDQLVARDVMKSIIKKLFSLATVVTPNLREVAAITGSEKIEPSLSIAKEAAKRIVDMGARAVVIKAIEQGGEMVDLLFDGREFTELAMLTHPKEKTHGSGCAFSAAITAGLANRLTLVEAVDQAKQLVNLAIQHGDGQGRGTTPVNVLVWATKKK
ncbi:MAG TPA: bifunctional hydroxymethylpyrimidine kinase/phosphomethylpyrimidine kinase [Tepidisphaeraceae bacterium]|jgi:hydroxymethylpyrimidine/phosphomethylpyrimidine kinase